MKIVILVLLFFTKVILCQIDSSKALVYFKEKNVVIYLNGEKIESQNKLKNIAVGKHKIKAWAPRYELLEDSFVVLKKENKFYTKKLKYNESYKAYRRKQNAFKLTYILPGIASILCGVNYYGAYNNINKEIDGSYSRALVIKQDYDKGYGYANASTEYYLEKANYESLIKKQVDLKKQGIIVSTACASTAVAFFVIDILRKRKPFNEKPLLAKISPSYSPLNNQVCLIIKL